MILTALIGVATALTALAVTKEATARAQEANRLNQETSAYVESSLLALERSSTYLENVLFSTKNLRSIAINQFAINLIYYLKHINENVSKEKVLNDEIERLKDAVTNYKNEMEHYANASNIIDPSLYSFLTGGTLTVVSVSALKAAGLSVSLGLGLSFFGVGSLLMSLFQASSSQNKLEEAQRLNANKETLKREIEAKVDIINTIAIIFDNYNSMLRKMTDSFRPEVNRVQKIYRKGIITSLPNMEKIAKGMQPEFDFDDFTKNEQEAIRIAVNKCKILVALSEKKLLTKQGTINETECREIGLING